MADTFTVFSYICFESVREVRSAIRWILLNVFAVFSFSSFFFPTGQVGVVRFSM